MAELLADVLDEAADLAGDAQRQPAVGVQIDLDVFSLTNAVDAGKAEAAVLLFNALLQTKPPAETAPAFSVEVPTTRSQALLYRLNGDINPIHANPEVAKEAGFDRPILHGLCFYGIAARVALKELAGDDPARFKSLEARFAKVVMPGDTLVVEATGFHGQAWLDRSGNHTSWKLKVTERYTPMSPYHLHYEATIEDPETFTEPWTIEMPLYRRMEADVQLMDFKCPEFVEELLYGEFRRNPLD